MLFLFFFGEGIRYNLSQTISQSSIPVPACSPDWLDVMVYSLPVLWGRQSAQEFLGFVWTGLSTMTDSSLSQSSLWLSLWPEMWYNLKHPIKHWSLDFALLIYYDFIAIKIWRQIDWLNNSILAHLCPSIYFPISAKVEAVRIGTKIWLL